MPTLKGLLFNQYAAEGLSLLVEELQSKYTAKKGRRFNHNNVTYEISRSSLNQGAIEYEISSKIPEDEIKNPKEMQAYFQQIKKILSKGKLKPESVEMENIVWDSKKETEKKRDYVKLLYKFSLDDLFDDQVVAEHHENIMAGQVDPKVPQSSSAFTKAGNVVLASVRDTIQNIGRENVNSLIEANKDVKAGLKG
ncbi:MAG: hypothetical protein VX495_03260 [Nitrospinota bacterium]|nr:hypothetical protein [Nitrospinota bacterium]MEC9423323.1 hypothetical protein [Nitrospinota bacterium]